MQEATASAHFFAGRYAKPRRWPNRRHWKILIYNRLYALLQQAARSPVGFRRQ